MNTDTQTKLTPLSLAQLERNDAWIKLEQAEHHADKLAEELREIVRKIDRDNLSGRYITSATREALAAYEAAK